MIKTCCQTCLHCDPIDPHNRMGYCRRLPPQVVFSGTRGDPAITAFPTVTFEDWCGQWQYGRLSVPVPPPPPPEVKPKPKKKRRKDRKKRRK